MKDKEWLKEEWKSLECLGYPDYLISNFGNVFSIKRNKQLKKHINGSDGYVSYQLWYKGKGKHFLAHRLVALTFIENDLAKPQVNHKDGVKNNNMVTNLEWVTRSENQIHAYETGLQKHTSMEGMNLNHPIMSKPVLQFDFNGNLIGKYPSAQEAARVTGVNRSTISRYLTNNKRRKHAGGYDWAFAEEVPE